MSLSIWNVSNSTHRAFLLFSQKKSTTSADKNNFLLPCRRQREDCSVLLYKTLEGILLFSFPHCLFSEITHSPALGGMLEVCIILIYYLKRFSFECRKTKTKVITPTNHNRRRQSNEPMRTQSKKMSPVPSAGKRVRASHDWFWFYFWLVKEVARDFLTNHKA